MCKRYAVMPNDVMWDGDFAERDSMRSTLRDTGAGDHNAPRHRVERDQTPDTPEDGTR